MYDKKKIIRNVILVLAILVILIILLTSLGDIKSIFDVLVNKTNYLYVLLGIFIVLIYALIFQLSLTVLIKKKSKSISFTDSMLISGTEYFFNGITPFSSGGQPFQAYALKRKNMKLSDSTSILLLNFLAYQIVINVFSIVCIFIYFTRLKEQINNLIWLLIIGFSINFIVMIIIILIGVTRFTGNFFIKIMTLLCRIKFLNKYLEKRIDSFEIYINEMQLAFKEIAKSKATWLLVIILKAISLMFYYSIPFFIYYAIGVDLKISNLFYIIAMCSFALTISVWVPTPGASGGAELAFTTLFSGLMIGYDDPQNLAMSGMLIWRLLTYYFLMIYGLFNYLLFERRARYEDRIIH